MREGSGLARAHDLGSLRHLASVGEPLNPEAVIWSRETFGRPFHDTYWQTETGCIVIANLLRARDQAGLGWASRSPASPADRPGPGAPRADRRARPRGLIALRPDWPSMMRALLGKPHGLRVALPQRLVPDRRPSPRSTATATSGSWAATDRRHQHRGPIWWAPSEIESASARARGVAESAAVAKPDAVNMEVVNVLRGAQAGIRPLGRPRSSRS